MDRTSSRSLCRGPRKRLRFRYHQISKIPGPRNNLASGEGGQVIIDQKGSVRQNVETRVVGQSIRRQAARGTRHFERSAHLRLRDGRAAVTSSVK